VDYNNTPQSFAAFLSKAKQYVDSHPNQPKLMTINAWNEWVEGSYLLPDMLNGFGYLEAVKDVMEGNKWVNICLFMCIAIIVVHIKDKFDALQVML
jgi:hypothetical protein